MELQIWEDEVVDLKYWCSFKQLEGLMRLYQLSGAFHDAKYEKEKEALCWTVSWDNVFSPNSK
jgi:hypothetical protein